MEHKHSHILGTLVYDQDGIKNEWEKDELLKMFFDNWLFPLIPMSHYDKISIPNDLKVYGEKNKTFRSLEKVGGDYENK